MVGVALLIKALNIAENMSNTEESRSLMGIAGNGLAIIEPNGDRPSWVGNYKNILKKVLRQHA